MLTFGWPRIGSPSGWFITMHENSDFEGERKPAISLDAEFVSCVNFASAQNDIPVIRALSLKNNGKMAATDLEVRVSMFPPVIRMKTWTIDYLPPDDGISLRDFSTPFNSEKLAGLNETERGTLTFEVLQRDKILVQEKHDLSLLAKDHWGGLADMDCLLAAYVPPNDDCVASLLRTASSILEAAGHDGALEGYQSYSPARAWMIAGAIWSAATGLGLTYVNPESAFEARGQKIRSPERIMREGIATCLDTSLLLAAAWEQAGLHPVVLFSEGHAFCGVWLTPKDFGAVIEPDVVAVRKAIQAHEFVAVETMLLTKRPAIGFDEASDAGRALLAERHEHEFVLAIDISRARSARIRPLSSRLVEAESAEIPDEVAPAGLPKPMDFEMLPEDVDESVPDTPKGRIERWQSKLLDLSLRNRLLNFKPTKQTVPCLIADVSSLKDALAAGKSFKICPLLEEDPIGARQVSPEEREAIISSAVQNAYERGQVTIPLNKSDTDKRLLALFRKAKSDLAEGGTNTLFLAAGFLRWQREGESRSYRAPLLLIPIKLTRRSARSEFRIVHHEDEVHFNTTLLEFLKRDFDLSLPELEGDLPTDESGINLPLIFQLIRNKVRNVRGFEAIEESAISTFSFVKYLMWKDLVDRTEDLRNNRLVAHLVDNPDQAFDVGGHAETVLPKDLDRRLKPQEQLTPLPVDSSQLAAVVAAMQERDFVLIGPPGTGKSQTITNIICQCLAHGKTILFVAEKAVALDVVQRRLHAHGLGDAVLELHSNKTDRKRVLTQLGCSWDRAAGQSEQDWIRVNKDLRIKRDQLNAYVEALHHKGTQGFSIFDALGWIAAQPKGLQLNFADKDAHDAESFLQLEGLADELSRTCAATSELPKMELVAAEDWSFAWESDFLEAVEHLRQAADRILCQGQSLFGRFGIDGNAAMTPARMAMLDTLVERTEAEARNLCSVPELSKTELLAALDAFKDLVGRVAAAKAELAAFYPEDVVLRMPLENFDLSWRTANASMWPISGMKRRKIRKMLQRYARSGTATPKDDLPVLRRMRKALEALEADPIMSMMGKDRTTESATTLCQQAIKLRDALTLLAEDVQDTAAFEAVQTELIARPDGALKDALVAWRNARESLIEHTRVFATLKGKIPDDMNVTDLIGELDLILANKRHLSAWTRWREVRAKADAAGLGCLADRIEDGTVVEPADKVFRCAYARWWLPLALDASEPLNRFLHWEHEHIVRAFRDLDAEAAKLAPAEVMRRIHHRLPARDVVPRKSELGTLRHQLGLKRPSMPIRTLLGNLTETFPRLAPCVLMSPLSIAQYLPAGQAVFDLVIFDEASQIPTWDAVGAIARARQSIIVGDPKQLPPTNFFGRSDDDNDEGDPLLGDMPSILDEVRTAGVPVRQLNWHYRSHDEALIAFSNHHYYGNRLVTFPAPVADSGAVQFHKIKGIYARGAGRTNQDEAKAIVTMIDRRLSDWLKFPEQERPTIGVITFNSQQQALILDLLDDLQRSRSDLEWFFAKDREEPVIVKNLENIQGDERDVILFSITFGPNVAGKLSMAFGALNQEGGEKRLNVAVTRARRELHVFSSITHDMIDLSRTGATGVRHLKTFLNYAERGSSALPAKETGSFGAAEKPFEEAVAEAIRAKGWEVRTQIGVSGFRIDLAVVNPDRPESYLAGIECDGATYHSSATARDRDKVRQAVLEGLGWNILRIWSVDWFRDPKAATNRLCKELEALLPKQKSIYAQPAEWVATGAQGNLFLTGSAGTGKTTLLRKFIAQAGGNTIVLAPTGVAAMNAGGQTLHSFFKFPPRLIEPQDVKRLRTEKLIKKVDTIIIDEISMVRADMLDAIDRSLKLNRSSKHPFGGVRMILSGDLHQLPPVVLDDEKPILKELYGGHYFFNAPAFKDAEFSLLVLKHAFRQKDPRFLSLLGAMRQGFLTPADDSVMRSVVSDRSALEASETNIVLSPYNANVYSINQARLDELPGSGKVFEAQIQGDFDEKSYPTEANLELKTGARVMLIRNDPGGRWVNGSVATVSGWSDCNVFIALDGREYEIAPAAWEKYKFSLDAETKKISREVVGTFKQVPVRLAYAVTIHKAQGLTLDKVYIDLDRGMFAHGQAYVAFSRARTLHGLEISRPLRVRDMVLDRGALAFGKLEPIEESDAYLLAEFAKSEDALL